MKREILEATVPLRSKLTHDPRVLKLERFEFGDMRIESGVLRIESRVSSFEFLSTVK